MIVCKELGESFETKEQLFKALKENKDKIIGVKKKTIYTGYDVANPEQSKQVISFSNVLSKYLDNSADKSLFEDDSYFYLAVNTTRILDSHRDLHKNGLWNKSAKEQSGKNYLLDTHQMTVKNTLVYPNDIEIFVADIPFKSVGKSYKGNTEALIYKFKKESVRDEQIKSDLEASKPLQASVKMIYLQMDLAMNSEEEEDKAEKKAFDDNISSIANIGEFKEAPLYFFIIKEARNIHESSLVPFGSNGATGQVKNIEPLKDTLNNEDEAVKNTSSYLLV